MPVKFVTDTMGEVEVNLKKAGNELVVPKPEIVLKVDGKPVQEVRVVADKRYLWRGKGVQLATQTKLVNPQDGKEVPSHEVLEVLDRYNYKYIDELFNEIEKKQVEYYAVYPDGKEEPVRPYERTTVIKIPEENWVPSTVLDEFDFENVYELYSTKEEVIRKLYEEAERRLKNDQVGIATFSFGGFELYFVFLVPYIKEGKFGWLVKFTRRKTKPNYSMDIPVKARIPIKELPTVPVLPPVQVLVASAKKKKKDEAVV
jgi:hypothetical protein